MKKKSLRTLKEKGQDRLYYTFLTVFIINVENLAKLRPKASKINDGNENLKRYFQAFLGPL
jgi:hypothetical protein